jgi:transposase
MYLLDLAKQEVQVLSQEDLMMIKALKKRGVYNVDIAAELGVHPKTVSRALRRGAAPSQPREKRSSKLDPYKAQIDALMKEDVWNAVVIWREIQAAGYQGGITIVREYITPKRAMRKSKATVRFETPPGQQLQSDWGETTTHIGGQEVTVDFMVNTLGYSRRFHFWCTDSQDAEHTDEGLLRSFEYFGGVTQEVLVDNQKSAVLSHRMGQGAVFNPRFVDLAGYYGFTPRACRPYRAQTKGKDERMVGYIKQHFFVRYRAFESLAHLNAQAEHWLREEADQRVHGTVKEVVSERFAREQPTLLSLPAVRFDTAYVENRRVSWDGYIEVRGNRYSVPDHLAGAMVRLRIDLEGAVRVYAQEQLVVTHQLQPRSHGWVSVPEHHRRLWQSVLHVEQRPLEVYEEAATWKS